MERVSETSPLEEIVELGSVSQDTKGPPGNQVDTLGAGQSTGLSDD
jgi:hypothetical protein